MTVLKDDKGEPRAMSLQIHNGSSLQVEQQEYPLVMLDAGQDPPLSCPA
jgi:hypothetical protein